MPRQSKHVEAKGCSAPRGFFLPPALFPVAEASRELAVSSAKTQNQVMQIIERCRKAMHPLCFFVFLPPCCRRACAEAELKRLKWQAGSQTRRPSQMPWNSIQWVQATGSIVRIWTAGLESQAVPSSANTLGWQAMSELSAIACGRWVRKFRQAEDKAFQMQKARVDGARGTKHKHEHAVLQCASGGRALG